MCAKYLKHTFYILTHYYNKHLSLSGKLEWFSIPDTQRNLAKDRMKRKAILGRELLWAWRTYLEIIIREKIGLLIFIRTKSSSEFI